MAGPEEAVAAVAAAVAANVAAATAAVEQVFDSLEQERAAGHAGRRGGDAAQRAAEPATEEAAARGRGRLHRGCGGRGCCGDRLDRRHAAPDAVAPRHVAIGKAARAVALGRLRLLELLELLELLLQPGDLRAGVGQRVVEQHGALYQQVGGVGLPRHGVGDHRGGLRVLALRAGLRQLGQEVVECLGILRGHRVTFVVVGGMAPL